MVAGLCGCAAAPEERTDGRNPDWPPLEFYVQHLTGTTKLAPGSDIRIVNHWGDIRVRSAPGGDPVMADAAVQRIGEPFPSKPRLAVSEDGRSFSLEVEYPGASLEPRTGRVDLAVFIPAGHAVFLETLDGTIETKRTRLDLTARSSSGEIRFINQGTADVETQSGRVVARPTEPGWGMVRLYSATGKVTAFLPAGAGLRVTARGTDEIVSDWPLSYQGGAHLITLGAQNNDRDEVLITSGRAIELFEIVLAPASP